MIGESTLHLEDKTGELPPMEPDGTGGGKVEEPTDLLAEIIKRINDVFGGEITEEDKVDIKHVQKRVYANEEVQAVMAGNNTELDKRDFMKKVAMDEIADYYGDRLDFYKKIMNDRVFPMIIEGLYREYARY
jgi:type I restriction enzyme R subunit